MMTEQQLGQRREALRLANEVRHQRAEIKRQLTDGELTFAQLLADPPDAIRNAPIGEVLLWAPGIGKWRKGRILASTTTAPAVPASIKVDRMSEKTKARVLERYEEWVPFRYGRTAVAA